MREGVVHGRADWLRLGQQLGGARLLLLAARVLAHLRIEGAARIPAHGACLFPFNHASPLADLLVNLVIRRRRPDVHVFAAQVLAGQNPLAAFLTRVDQRAGDARLLLAYKARGLSGGELLRAYRILQGGGAIAIAAEGELTWDGRLQHPLAPGAAWLALRTGAPIVPVVSVGGYDVQPRWQMDRLRLPGRLTIRVGEPFTLGPDPQPKPNTHAARGATIPAGENALAVYGPRSAVGVFKSDSLALEAANEHLWQVMAGLLAG